MKIIEDLGMRRENSYTRRWCIAECPYCNKQVEMRTQQTKTTKSCGCATFLKAQTSHGMSRTRQYQIWADMKDRCTNPKNKSYIRYGERGISYDPSWETFEGFWNDMADGYDDTLTIERNDNNIGYCKSNCTWITIEEQVYNRHHINTFKQRKADSYKKIISIDDIIPFGEKYKTAKYGEKLSIVNETVEALGISINTAKIYLSKYIKGKLCKLS